MNKDRLESLSDGVFSIAMTILVFNVSIPAISGTPTNTELWSAIDSLELIIGSYFVSFAVLAMFWISHNFFYSSFTREVNRKLVLINMLYLSFLAFIPFSTRLLGEYSTFKIPVMLYGFNVLMLGIASWGMLHYAIYSDEIDTSHISQRNLNQVRIRSL